MRIAEAADLSGLSIDTIRYYEKVGLLPVVARGGDGHRRFSPEMIDWLHLLRALRDTGMPMKTMSAFAELYRHGDHTIAERKKILLEHAERLRRKQDQLTRCEDLLRYKLKMYDQREAAAAALRNTK